MGNELSNLYEKEKQSWSVTFFSRNIYEINKQIKHSNCFYDFNKISLCYKNAIYKDYKYKHFFIIIENHNIEEIIEFDNNDFINSKIILHNKTNLNDVVVLKYKDVDENDRIIIQKRIIKLLGFKEYSLLLRNCEHIAYYIYMGSWCSFQVIDEQINMFNYFRDKLTNNVKTNLNTLPNFIELSDKEIDKLDIQLKEIYVNKIKNFNKYNLKEDFIYNIKNIIGDYNWELNYDSSDKNGKKINDNTKVIVLLGPTGSGKSRIINVLLNQNIADSRLSGSSVTSDITYYYCNLNGKTIKNKHICFVDTVGLCDTNLNELEIYDLIKSKINYTVKKIDQVYFVLNQRLEKIHIDSCNKYITWLNLEKNKINVNMIFTKCEGMNTLSKNDLLLSLRKIEFINKIYYEGILTTFGNEKIVNYNNIMIVGFPDSKNYNENVFKMFEKSMIDDYKSLMAAVTFMVENLIYHIIL